MPYRVFPQKILEFTCKSSQTDSDSYVPLPFIVNVIGNVRMPSPPLKETMTEPHDFSKYKTAALMPDGESVNIHNSP